VAVQFLLGLHRRAFTIVLGAVALAEPLLLLNADSLTTFATRVLIVQAAGAVALVAIGAAVRRDPLAGSEPVL
jgi:hypothetical protein